MRARSLCSHEKRRGTDTTIAGNTISGETPIAYLACSRIPAVPDNLSVTPHRQQPAARLDSRKSLRFRCSILPQANAFGGIIGGILNIELRTNGGFTPLSAVFVVPATAPISCPAASVSVWTYPGNPRYLAAYQAAIIHQSPYLASLRRGYGAPTRGYARASHGADRHCSSAGEAGGEAIQACGWCGPLPPLPNLGIRRNQAAFSRRRSHLATCHWDAIGVIVNTGPQANHGYAAN